MTSKRILVADDDNQILKMLTLSLNSLGFDVTCAEDGQIFFNKAVTEDFDLIITDIKMPNWNGDESIYGLNLIDNKVKIIVISGFIEEKLKRELSTYKNIVSIYRKPFNILDVLKKVRETLIC